MKSQKQPTTGHDELRHTFNEWIEDLTHRANDALERGVINKKEYSFLSSALMGVRSSADSGNAYLAAIMTNAYWGTVYKLEKPALVASILSSVGRKAVKAKHAKVWTPAKLVALEKEAERYRDKFEHPQTLHKHLSKLIFKTDKKHRQIKTQLEKIAAQK